MAGCGDCSVPWNAGVHVPRDPTLDKVADALDPVLAPLGFARGQLGSSESEASVIFCRGDEGSYDGTWVDLVIDLRPHPAWRITDVLDTGASRRSVGTSPFRRMATSGLSSTCFANASHRTRVALSPGDRWRFSGFDFAGAWMPSSPYRRAGCWEVRRLLLR